MQSIEFPWSDNWWIEGDRAWFCGGEINALFCVDMNSGKCKLVARIPECDFRGFRLYSYCIKHGDIIFCLPGIESYIWCYDLCKGTWGKIEARNRNQLVASTNIYRSLNSRVLLSEDGMDRILEINLEKKVIKKVYNLPTNKSDVFDGGILVDNKLYRVADDKVYCIDIDRAEINVYEGFGAQARLATICYDGCNFWISGLCKEIYVWNPEQGIVKTLSALPEQFGLYRFHQPGAELIDYDSFVSTEQPFFNLSFLGGKYIWYIPLQSNEILYIDKETYKINILEIEGEQETEESLQRDFGIKYLVQYIRADRYIGLYSLKNKLIVEIDTVDLCVQKRNYKLSGQTLLDIAQADGYYDGRRMLRENREEDQLLFSSMLSLNDKPKINFSQNIGELIYHTMNE